jgi:hypothetical protein
VEFCADREWKVKALVDERVPTDGREMILAE